MTSRPTWKAFERRIAKDQGTSRTPLSGSCSGHTSGDTLHPKLYSEAKYRKKWALWTLFESVKAQAANEGKVPALFLKEKGKRGYLVCVHSDDFFSVVSQYRQGKAVRDA